jgi:hypothetical protein
MMGTQRPSTTQLASCEYQVRHPLVEHLPLGLDETTA